MVTHQTFQNHKNEWIGPDEIIYNKESVTDNQGNKVKVGKIEKMSKSKKNIVDPSDIIERYGADTARWFMLSDSPPERDLEWTESGATGSYKFINRVWNLLQLCLSDDYIENNKTDNQPLKEKTDETKENVTDNINIFHYNKSIASLYELVNFLQKIISNKSSSKKYLKESFKNLALLLQPFTPHLSEEVWKSLGLNGLAINQLWPNVPTARTVKIYKIAIQIDGKTREIIEFDVGSNEEEVKIKALNSKKIKKMIDKKIIKKTIFVPEKIFNMVLK